jgi:hypothetical protein
MYERREMIMAQENLKNLVGVILFYALIVFGVIALNARVEYINSTSGTNATLNEK